MAKVKIVKNYIAGKWRDAERTGLLDVENPGTGEVIAKVPLSTESEVDHAVEAAALAFPQWSHTPVARRVSYLYALRNVLRDNEEKISQVLVSEMGKSLPDARVEMKRVFENIEVACGMPMLQQGNKVVGCSYDIDGEIIRAPLGAFGMIAPFNFPAMAPFWFIPYAIATGNTFITKPSELVPLTMELITEYIDQTGLPPGVFNLVNGDKTAASALVDNPKVSGISFVGKSETCRIIAQKCAAANKRYQAMGSAKNHLVVMPDYYQIDELIRNMSTSCYGCAGQ